MPMYSQPESATFERPVKKFERRFRCTLLLGAIVYLQAERSTWGDYKDSCAVAAGISVAIVTLHASQGFAGIFEGVQRARW
jgi:hypothetical protein